MSAKWVKADDDETENIKHMGDRYFTILQQKCAYQYVKDLNHANLSIAHIADDPEQTGNTEPVTKARGERRPHQRAFLLQPTSHFVILVN